MKPVYSFAYSSDIHIFQNYFVYKLIQRIISIEEYAYLLQQILIKYYIILLFNLNLIQRQGKSQAATRIESHQPMAENTLSKSL